jgi:uncharacterized membrane protein YfcA
MDLSDRSPPERTAAPTAHPAVKLSSGELLVLVAAGIAAGAFGGLVGVGGNVILIALMGGSGKWTQQQAQATSLVVLVFTGLSGGTRYALTGAVDFWAALALALPAVLAAQPGARFAHAMAEWRLKRVFGGFLLVVSILLLLQHRIPGLAHPFEGGARLAILFATGALTGFASGLLGVGGGSLMVPSMVLLAGFGQHLAQGTSLVAMVPVGAAAAWAHWSLGNVVRRVLPPLVLGVLVGAFLGGSAAAVLNDLVLRVAFAGVLVWTGIWFLRARRSSAGPARGRLERLLP